MFLLLYWLENVFVSIFVLSNYFVKGKSERQCSFILLCPVYYFCNVVQALDAKNVAGFVSRDTSTTFFVGFLTMSQACMTWFIVSCLASLDRKPTNHDMVWLYYWALLALSPHDLHLFLLLGFSSTHVTNKSEDNQPVPRVKKRNGSILLGEAGQPASHAAAALQYLSRSGREKSPGARVTEAVEYLELQRTRARAATRWETMTSLHDSLVDSPGNGLESASYPTPPKINIFRYSIPPNPIS